MRLIESSAMIQGSNNAYCKMSSGVGSGKDTLGDGRVQKLKTSDLSRK